jgi:hypothetical protein
MSDPKQGKSDLKRDEKMSTSAAAHEAFQYLNALQKTEYRGWGDTATAARDRAARKAGVSPAQAERVWKRWQSMKTVNGDVYRALRNRYEAMCQRIENAADAIDRAAGEIEDANAVRKRIRSAGESHSTLD